MRVRIDENMKICPWGQMLELKAGEETDGPLARWLAEDSGCPVTVLDDEGQEEETAEPVRNAAEGNAGDETTPDAAAEETPAEDTTEAADGQEPEQDGSLTADLAATSTTAVAPKATTGKSGAKGK